MVLVRHFRMGGEPVQEVNFEYVNSEVNPALANIVSPK